MSARDTLAKAIYDNDCEIAAKIADDGMPLVPWEQFKRDNPESAAVTTTFAGVYLSALRAAGWAVVPREPTGHQLNASAASVGIIGARARPVVLHASTKTFADIYRAMLTAAEEPPHGP